jgi:dihydroceramidase
MVNRNPVYHQAIFASLVIGTAMRITYILKYTDAAQRIPEEKKETIANFFITGAVQFAVGFGVWNLDNIFCTQLTEWKVALGWPLAFLLEGTYRRPSFQYFLLSGTRIELMLVLGHSWWHILTGLGSYYMFIGIQCMSRVTLIISPLKHTNFALPFKQLCKSISCYGCFNLVDLRNFSTLCTKDDPKNYHVQRLWGLPHVKRTKSKVQ